MCTDDEMTEYGRMIASDIPESLPMQAICARKTPKPLDAGAIIIIILICILLLMALIGGVIEYLELREAKKKEVDEIEFEEDDDEEKEVNTFTTLRRVFLAFSPITNFNKLLAKTSVPHLASVNGLRIFSLLWVILGHTIYWATFSSGFENALYVMTKVLPKFSSNIIVNAPLSVDSFFYMSGFLVAYLSTQEYEKKGKMKWLLYYFHRIYRLTPPYIMALFVFWKLTPHLGTGPWWEHVNYYISLRQCQTLWWTNLLYLNNFYPTVYDEQCMGWSWYMANDWQMYAITPIFLIVYWRWRRAGVLLINLGIIISLSLNAGFAYYYKFTPYAAENAYGRYNSVVYEKPYMRINVYFVGMLAAFLLHHLESTNSQKKRMSWGVWILVYLISGLLMFFSVFGTYGLYQNRGEWKDAQKLIYLTFSRFGWSVGLAIMMHTFYVGHGWLLRKFFEWRIWSVLARLSFSAYLYHPIVMTVVYYSSRQMFYYSPWTIIVNFLAFILLSFAVSLVSFMLIERPLMNLEKIIIGG